MQQEQRQRDPHWLTSLSRLLFVIWLSVAPGALPAQDAPVVYEPEKQVHWAVGAFFGTGWYRVSDNRSVYILRIPPRQTVRKAELKPDGSRVLGIEIQYALSLGLSRLDDVPDFVDFDNYSTISFTPGVQIEIPVNRRWSLRPFVHLGYGWESETQQGALIWYGGIKSRYRLSDGATRWSVINGLYYAGYKPQFEQRGQYGALKTGLESSMPLQVSEPGEDRLFLNAHLTYEWFFDRLNFHVDENRVRSFRDQWEIGLAIGKRGKPIRIGFLDFEHIGLAYRFSSDSGFDAITVNLRSPFTY